MQIKTGAGLKLKVAYVERLSTTRGARVLASFPAPSSPGFAQRAPASAAPPAGRAGSQPGAARPPAAACARRGQRCTPPTAAPAAAAPSARPSGACSCSAWPPAAPRVQRTAWERGKLGKGDQECSQGSAWKHVRLSGRGRCLVSLGVTRFKVVDYEGLGSAGT